jgi:hypothetical protein
LDRPPARVSIWPAWALLSSFRALQLALLVAAAGIALIRMNRFDGLFARELYMTFINTCMPAVGG